MRSASKSLAASRDRPSAAPFESGVVVAREARHYPRRDVACVASVATLDRVEDGEGAPHFLVTQGATFNIGDGGLGLRVETAIRCGSRVLVDLALDGGRTIECFARVVWATSDAEGTQFIGLSFDRPRPGFAETV